MVPLKRKERDRQLREQDILRAAEHVFATRGFHDAAIQDIAKDAQYATGTIYLYFKDKEALYLALVEKKFSHFFSLIKEKVDEAKDPDEKLKVLVSQQLAYFAANQDFYRIYFSERDGLRWAFKNKFSASTVNKFTRYLDYITCLIRKAQGQGLIRNDFDAKHLAFVLYSAVKAVIMRWLRQESYKTANLGAASDFIMDVFLNGAGRKK